MIQMHTEFKNAAKSGAKREEYLKVLAGSNRRYATLREYIKDTVNR
ncbi:50S ribosomal protein L14, partial [Francisella tularensis subsp. holarctica]|nr:50S ribosomal protein L14 [Francisella tularensis subsp. holarctica]